MLTLTYGFKKPQTGDFGTTFWPALEDDIQQLNDHTHNGTNSAQLTTASVVPVTDTVLAASWSHQGGGTYRQQVTMPAGMLFDDYQTLFKDSSGNQLFLSVSKTGASTYYVYINDNSLQLTVYYV